MSDYPAHRRSGKPCKEFLFLYRYHFEMCLLTIYRLPFQVSGRVSDGLILDSFSQKFLVKRSVRIANCLRAWARVFAIQRSELRTFKNGPTKPVRDSFRNRHLLPENSLEAYSIFDLTPKEEFFPLWRWLSQCLGYYGIASVITTSQGNRYLVKSFLS